MHWTDAVKAFTRILRTHGLDPDAVVDVGRAWEAFREFVQLPLGGVAPVEEDGDGFIVQWGRWSWDDGQPSLGFTRQVGVWEEGEVELWGVELTLYYGEDPAWAGLGSLAWNDSMGFDFDPIGPERSVALDGIAAFVATIPEVRALWQAVPVSSALKMERAG
ncbi:hypothetical protein [Kitasatospora albolonga]